MINRTVILVAALLLAGCTTSPEPELDGNEGPEINQPEAGQIIADRFEGTWTAGATTPAMGVNVVGSGNAIVKSYSHPGVFELTWSATTPANEQLSLRIRDADLEETVATATGTSPIRIALDVTPSVSALIMRAPEPAGVYVDQPFTMSWALFDGLPLDESHEFE